MTVVLWSTTAATNATADSTVNWRESQAPSTVNNSARAMMAAIAKWRDDISGNTVTGGSSTAYTATSFQGLTPLVDGYTITVRMHTTNGASATLNVDATGSKAIRTYTSTASIAGSLNAGSVQRFTYDSTDDCWYVHGFQQQTSTLDVAGTRAVFNQTTAPIGWTKDATAYNHALRLVGGSITSSAGVAFTTAFASQGVSGTVGNTALTVAQLPPHTHGYHRVDLGGAHPTGSGRTDGASATDPQTDSTGNGDTHTHSFTGNAINLAVQYMDVMIAQKN